MFVKRFFRRSFRSRLITRKNIQDNGYVLNFGISKKLKFLEHKLQPCGFPFLVLSEIIMFQPQQDKPELLQEFEGKYFQF